LFSDYNLAKVQPLSYDVQKQIAKSRGVSDEKFFKSLEGKYSELAKTPLLLSLMISEFKESKSLPNVRADLYGRAINTMINIFFQKNLSFLKESNSDNKKQDLMLFLMKLAVLLHDKRTRDFESEIIEDMGEEFMTGVWKTLKPLIDEAKFSLIILLNDQYRFSHLSFQEYFVARAWSSKNEANGSIITVESNFFGIKSVKFSKKVKEMIIDPWYRETFLLCAGAMEQSDFLAFGKHLLSLYKSQGGLIDSIVYNMIKERPDEEKASYTNLITNLNSEKKLLRLMDGLIHDSDNLREIAVSRIKMYKKKSSKLNKFLVKHLSDDNNYAAESMSLLTIKGDQEMIKLLLEELALKNETSKRRICFVLGNVTESADQVVIDKLLEILKEDSKQKEVVREAIIALGKVTKVGDKVVIDVLLKHIGDYHVRDVAATALGIIAESGDVDIIEQLTKISNVCEEACISLGKIGLPGDRQIIDTLLKALDSNTFDEIKIIQALGNITKGAVDDEYATEKLLSFIEKGKRRLATRAAAALGEAVEKSDKFVIKNLIELCDQNTNNRPFAALALGYCSRKGSKKVVAKLLELLSDQNAHHSVRVSAAESITRVARYNDPKVISVLVQRLSDTEEVCIAVSNTLIELAEKGSPEVIDAFIDLLKHPDPGVIQKAVEVLGKIAKSQEDEETSPKSGIQSPKTKPFTKEEDKTKIQKESNLKVIKALKDLISSDSSTEAIKAVSVESLGLIAPPNDESVIELMSDLLNKSNSVIIRRQCIIGLGNLIKSKQNEKTLELLYSVLLNDPETVDASIETLSKIGDMAKMIDLFKNVKEARPVLFTVIIHSVRRLRGEDPNYQLSKENTHILQKINCLESVFILVEHAS
jgi:HEAT repeat protein